MKFTQKLRFSFTTLLLISCEGKKEVATAPRDSLELDFKVINTLPHNTNAFTEGLVVYNNKILESTGQYNYSWIAEVNPGSGDHTKKVNLDEQYFGEGITVLNNKIYHLTYHNKIGFIYNASNYEKLGEFAIRTKEGWGLTHDSVNLIMTDGSERLYFLDTAKFNIVKTVIVNEAGQPVRELNELEFINGYIYANVWQTNYILKIEPASGNVIGKLNLSALSREAIAINPNADVLNGIAYDKKGKTFIVTGKYWPQTYLLKVK